MGKSKLLMLVMIVLFSALLADASDNITLNYPGNSLSCVSGMSIQYQYTPIEPSLTTCFLWTNSSGSWSNPLVDYNLSVNSINFFNDSSVSPSPIMWQIVCSNATNSYFYSPNYTYTLTSAPYCASLTETSCPSEISLGSDGIFKTRLGNTKGFWLENQDCKVWIEDNESITVKSFDSMMIDAQTSIMLDNNGNYINTAAKSGVVLTDSNGWYVFPFTLEKSWAWYGTEYTIHASCNGQEVTCNFNATKERLPDTNDLTAIGKEAGGLVVFGIIILVCILAALRYGWRRIRRR